MALQSDLGIAIQRLRKEHNISQEKLALEAGIDRRYMSDIENGKRNISLDIIERIANYFHVPVSRLFVHAEEVSHPSITLDEIKNTLCERGYEDSVVLENPDYLSAIIGVTENGRVIYSYEKMLGWLINEEKMDEEEAIDFLSYNTIRSLPYAGEMAPIVMFDL